MKNELKVKLLEFWQENLENVSKIPNELKDRISEKEALDMVDELGDINLEIISNKIDKIRTEMREDAQLKLNEKMEKHNRNLSLYTKILVIVTALSVAVLIISSGITYLQYTFQKDFYSPNIFPFSGLNCPSYEEINSKLPYSPTFYNVGQRFGTIRFIHTGYSSSIIEYQNTSNTIFVINEKDTFTPRFYISPEPNVFLFGFSINAITDNSCFFINCSYKKIESKYELETTDIKSRCD